MPMGAGEPRAVFRPMMPVTWASRRGPVIVVLVAGSLAGLVGCGGGGSGSDGDASATAAKAPSGCEAAPFSVGLGVGAGTEAAPFEVVDAAAQRVSILPGKMAFDASEMAGLTSQAGVSPLGEYTIYLSDGTIPTEDLGGSGYPAVADGAATVAAVRIAPAADGGFLEGEVAAPTGELGYETRSEIVPVRAGIAPEGSASDLELTEDLTGTVTVLQVGRDDICVDIDVTIAGAEGGQIDGIVLAPVTRAGDAFFIT